MERNAYLKKLYFKQWVIGITRGDIKDIIRRKNFPQDEIKWIQPDNTGRFYADPFILKRPDGEIHILYEDFSIEDHYGNISLMTLNEKFEVTGTKLLLDTGRHLSFPFMFRDNGRIFVIPESVRTGNVSYFEYNPEKKSLTFRDELLRMPLYDPTVFKMDDMYWLFGSVYENRERYKLHIFCSSRLKGPYFPLKANPVRAGLNGIRAAGNLIEVDGDVFRPAQNCEHEYGESITINRLKVLDEFFFSEEPYMNINISRKNQQENSIHTLHTLNFDDDLIVVDGMKWTFSPREQWKNFRRNRRILKHSEFRDL